MKRLMCLAVLMIAPFAMVGCGGGLEESKEGEGAASLEPMNMMDAGKLPEGGPDAKTAGGAGTETSE